MVAIVPLLRLSEPRAPLPGGEQLQVLLARVGAVDLGVYV